MRTDWVHETVGRSGSISLLVSGCYWIVIVTTLCLASVSMPFNG